MSSQQTATMMIVVSPSRASRSGATYCRKLSLVTIGVETGPGLVCPPGGQPGDSHGRASLGFQDGWGHRGTPCPELLALLPWERLGEPCNPRTQESQNQGKPSCDMPAGTPDTDPWGSSGSPEWGSWSQYQKDSGGGRKWVISGHLGGWPMEGVFFSYGVWSSHSVGVLRMGFSSF